MKPFEENLESIAAKAKAAFACAKCEADCRMPPSSGLGQFRAGTLDVRLHAVQMGNADGYFNESRLYCPYCAPVVEDILKDLGFSLVKTGRLRDAVEGLPPFGIKTPPPTGALRRVLDRVLRIGTAPNPPSEVLSVRRYRR